jgi:hypothetical protein
VDQADACGTHEGFLPAVGSEARPVQPNYSGELILVNYF